MRNLNNSSQRRNACVTLAAYFLLGQDIYPMGPGIYPVDSQALPQDLTTGPAKSDPRYWEKNRLFRAYDCSRPFHVRTVVPPQPTDCDLQSAIKNVEARNFIILQTTKYTTFPAKRCTYRKTAFGYHCGMHSHISVIPKLWEMDQPQEMDVATCNALHASGRHGSLRAITNGTTDVTETTIGSASDSGSCRGGTMRINGVSHSKMVVLTNRKIETSVVRLFKTAAGRLSDKANTLELPGHCTIDSNSCAADKYSPYSWTLTRRAKQEADCHLYKTREVSGSLATLESGGQFFVSNTSMVRLIIKKTESKCGTSVYGTNFPGIFLAEVDAPSILQRPIDPQQLDMPTLMRQLDSFTLETLREERDDHINRLRRQFCVEIQENDRLKYGARAAAQAAIADGETTSLGDGNFAMAAGEAFYEFRCPAITVWGVSNGFEGHKLPVCYGSLEVVLQDDDLVKWKEARSVGLNETNPTFFIEPRTHRLTTVGARVPCAPTLPPMYQNKFGQWMSKGTGTLTPAQPPAEMTIRIGGLARPEEVEADPEYNFAEGGIFDPALVRKLDSYYSIIRQGKSLPVELSSQMALHGNHGSPEYIGVGDVFPSVAFFNGGILGWLFHTFKDYALIMFGVWITFKIITWAIDLFSYCARVQDHNHSSGRRRLPGWLHGLLPTQLTATPWRRQVKQRILATQELRDLHTGNLQTEVDVLSAELRETRDQQSQLLGRLDFLTRSMHPVYTALEGAPRPRQPPPRPFAGSMMNLRSNITEIHDPSPGSFPRPDPPSEPPLTGFHPMPMLDGSSRGSCTFNPTEPIYPRSRTSSFHEVTRI